MRSRSRLRPAADDETDPTVVDVSRSPEPVEDEESVALVPLSLSISEIGVVVASVVVVELFACLPRRRSFRFSLFRSCPSTPLFTVETCAVVVVVVRATTYVDDCDVSLTGD